MACNKIFLFCCIGSKDGGSRGALKIMELSQVALDFDTNQYNYTISQLWPFKIGFFFFFFMRGCSYGTRMHRAKQIWFLFHMKDLSFVVRGSVKKKKSPKKVKPKAVMKKKKKAKWSKALFSIMPR